MPSPLSPDHVRRFIDAGALRPRTTPFPPPRPPPPSGPALGLSPDDPAGWTRPVVRIPHLAHPALVAAANAPRLTAAYDALVGEGRWVPPTAVGSIPVRFPSPEDPGDAGWHVDMALGLRRARLHGLARERPQRRPRAPRPDALLGRGRRRRADPPAARLAPGRGAAPPAARARGALAARPRGGRLRGDGGPARRRSPPGPAGTAWLCHPFLVHAAQPHRGRVPRLMAQQTLAPAHARRPRPAALAGAAGDPGGLRPRALGRGRRARGPGPARDRLAPAPLGPGADQRPSPPRPSRRCGRGRGRPARWCRPRPASPSPPRGSRTRARTAGPAPWPSAPSGSASAPRRSRRACRSRRGRRRPPRPASGSASCGARSSGS